MLEVVEQLVEADVGAENGQKLWRKALLEFRWWYADLPIDFLIGDSEVVVLLEKLEGAIRKRAEVEEKFDNCL